MLGPSGRPEEQRIKQSVKRMKINCVEMNQVGPVRLVKIDRCKSGTRWTAVCDADVTPPGRLSVATSTRQLPTDRLATLIVVERTRTTLIDAAVIVTTASTKL